MSLKFILSFGFINLLAFICLLVYKFWNQPVKIVHERTSIMNKEEKQEIVNEIIQRLNIPSNSLNKSISANSNLENLPRPVSGRVYFANNEFVFRSTSQHDFFVGSRFPYDASKIVCIDWDLVETEKGIYLIQNSVSSLSSQPSSSSSSGSPSTTSSFSLFGS